MRKRKLGRTGLEVSELVFGGGWVGGILIHTEDETKREAIRRAFEGGINFIDTAPSYGQGRSEEALGWLLKEVESQPVLGTKVRLDCSDLSDIAGQIERSMAESLGRLQRNSVDILQLHNPIAPDTDGSDVIGIQQVLGEGGAADGLERMREQGLTRHVGLTALGDTGAVHQAVESGRFDTAQVYFNLLNPSAGRAMPPRWTGQDFANLISVCKAQDTGIVVIRALASGVLATDERHGREVVITRDADLEKEQARARAALEALGLDETGHTSYGTRSQTALRFVLANPDISCTEVGMAELDHLEQALAAAEAGPLPEEALEALERVYESDFGMG